MKELHLGRGVAFPAEDFIESKMAILGQSSQGKSGCTKVLVEELAEKSGYAMQGGSFRTYLSRLSSLELVEYVDGNGVKASKVVFVEDT